MKRGQVTIFIIIAILLIALAGLTYFVLSKKEISEITDPDVDQVYSTIENCVEITLVDGARLIGLQGGYHNLPKNYLETDLSKIAYGYEGKRNTLISISEMEDEISSYIEMALPWCLDESYFDLTLRKEKANVKTEIGENEVSIKVNFPVSVTKDESTSLLDETYNKKVSLRLKDMHSISNKIIDGKINDPNFIDLTYLSELDYSISILPFEDGISVYIITDEKNELNHIPYVFRFAVIK